MSQPSIYETLLRYPSQLPRYTSYPTAPHFKSIKAEGYSHAIAGLAEVEPISLYLHIPFCQQLCWFCGCHTKITSKYAPIKKYLSLIEKEMELIRKTANGKKLRVSHIHFGGGSPSLLACSDFKICIQSLHDNFDIRTNAQIAIEIDPRTTNEAKIATYAKAGINRVSIGVQDFNHDVQVAINRIQPLKTVYDTVMLCREYGITQINFDLIYGLPGQTLEDIKRNIEYSFLLSPSRIAVFGYAHVPWKKKNIRLIKEENLPSGEMRMQLYDTASKMLKEAGYVAIGIDHFAKTDDSLAIAYNKHNLRRNFQGYSADNAHALLGIGASAISSFSQGYFQNNPLVNEYRDTLLANKLPIIRGFYLNDEDRVRRKIIEEIMCYLSVDLTHLLSLLPNAKVILSSLQSLAKDELIRLEDNIISVNKNVPQAARIVCSLFDHHHGPNILHHSKVA